MTRFATNDVPKHPRARPRGQGRRAWLLGGAAALAVSLSAVSLSAAGMSAASAAPGRTRMAGTTPRAAAPIVVKAATRKGFGKILVTGTGGATLYRDTNDGPNDPTCTGSCATVWPPLLAPAGDTKPKGGPGVTGLGTVKLSDGDLQVTYHKKPLYTFSGDSGHSVNGNGIGPFLVVKS
jgi:predicted lipoprotein with Yx(FWY)xxD motif